MRIYNPAFSIDMMRSLIWQYDSAENLSGVLQKYQDWRQENVAQFWNDWFRDVYDIRTANDFGLSVWSIILNVPLTGPESTEKEGPSWAFGSARQNFGRGNFGGSSAPVPLQTEQKRILLQMRYYQLTSRGAIPETNRFLKALFEIDYGPAYLRDNLDMTVEYVFGWTVDASLRHIFDTLDVLPRPAAVGATYVLEPVCVPPEYGDYPTNNLPSLVDASDTFAVSVVSCDAAIIQIDSWQATGGEQSIVLSSSVGAYLYKLFINGVMVDAGAGADGTLWGPASATYTANAEVVLIIYTLLKSQTASVSVGFNYNSTVIPCALPAFGDLVPDDDVTVSLAAGENSYNFSGTLSGCVPYVNRSTKVATDVDVPGDPPVAVGSRFDLIDAGTDDGVVYTVYVDGVEDSTGTFTSGADLLIYIRNPTPAAVEVVTVALQNSNPTQSFNYQLNIGTLSG